jgi:hypothetical protein
MRKLCRLFRWPSLALVLSVVAGCDDPQVYGSVGVSTGFGSWGSGSRVHTSISVGGRIR